VPRIAWPVDHRQPQHCPREFGVAQDSALHRDLVVLLVQPREDLLHHPHLRHRIRVQLRAKRGILPQRQWLERVLLAPMHHVHGAVDVHARRDDDATRVAAKDVHERGGLTAGAQDQVDDDVRHEGAECAGAFGQVVSVAANGAGALRKRLRALGPLEHRDVVAAVDEARDDESPDEAGAADNENAHVRPYMRGRRAC
jgi:hypothetical protein